MAYSARMQLGSARRSGIKNSFCHCNFITFRRLVPDYLSFPTILHILLENVWVLNETKAEHHLTRTSAGLTEYLNSIFWWRSHILYSIWVTIYFSFANLICKLIVLSLKLIVHRHTDSSWSYTCRLLFRHHFNWFAMNVKLCKDSYN